MKPLSDYYNGKHSPKCLPCIEAVTKEVLEPEHVVAKRRYQAGLSAKRRAAARMDEDLAIQLLQLNTKADEIAKDLHSRPVTEGFATNYWCEGPKGRSFPTVRKMTPEEQSRAVPRPPFALKPKGRA